MTQSKLKVFIIGGGHDYERMFKAHGWDVTTTMEDADLIQFTGGSDVSPVFYGEPPHPTTQSNYDRDVKEKELFLLAQGMGIPCAGICRGGQFLNVMNGGTLYQNVDNHAIGPHKAFAIGHIGPVTVTSTHHQMIRPNTGQEYVLLMTANEAHVKEYMSPSGIVYSRHVTDKKEDDVEAVYYPHTNSLCFQPHPEFNNATECAHVYFYFINNYLMKELDVEEATRLSKVIWK